MKKILPILIVVVLIISGIGAVASPVSDLKQEKRVLSFSQLSINENEDSITLELEGTNAVLMKKDHYMVPNHIETFIFPFGTQIRSVNCNPKDIQRKIITKELAISPDPVIISQVSLNEKSSREINPITTDSWYEYDVGTGLNGNERVVIVKVQVFPLQYHPSENIIDWAETVEIDVDYVPPESPINFEDEYMFVVIGPADFSDELDDLIQHKINRGISTIFVSLDDIYNGVHFPVEGRDNQEKIKYFIKNAIESWGTSYILLVGGNLKLPVRTSHIHIDANPPDNEEFVSDLYYADIYNDTGGFSTWDTNENDVFAEFDWGSGHLTDDLDLFPDVYIGRLACINANEVTTSVNKIITYETNEAYTQEWFTNLVLVGGDSFPGDDNEVNEGEYVNDAVADIMDGFIPDRVWASNGRLSGLVPTGVSEINDALDAGVGFVDFSGHGNTFVWATHPHEVEGTWLPTPTGGYLNSQVAGLTNGDELPIVITGACSVSKFAGDADCFSWSFVSNSNGGGIASFGATGLGWAYIGEWVTEGLIEGISIKTFEAYKNEGAITLGEMWGKALENYISVDMEGTDYKTIEEWQLLGDPTLAVGEESQPPAIPEDLDGPTTGNINEEHTYTASTTDPDGDELYYLFDWGDGEFSGWVGPFDSGDTADASYTWTEQGSYEIRVKAKDTHGVQSGWSDPLPVSMPKSKGYFSSILLEILQKLMERFPLLEKILSYGPIISGILEI